MKNFKLALIPLFILLTGCLDSSSSSYDDTDDLAFYEEFSQQNNVTKTSSGLLYRVIEEGEGVKPGPESIVLVHLEGATIDESTSVNTFENDTPTLILLQYDLAGYQEGIQLMNIGSMYEMVFPTQLAFGDGRVIHFERIRLLNTQEGFVEGYTQQEDVTTTDSGLRYRVIQEGEGESPDENSSVVVNYTGTLINGLEFGSQESVTFNLGGTNPPIEGFGEGLQLMSPGSTYEFLLPANLAYGNQPPTNSYIYPGAVLLFEVELLSIQ
ncbi:FKBP-type peptidyl-prolyl cis-trans isomerase [Rhodohalobacter sp. 614A]|uniref:FKBP-type peptidyl-prolyl cis-trans isomerase n=1 Tax=Rhodohalobacter sp. 614A TaxID=2908649 RepID=UPI001F287085|nr:FKBP-type peptidyl-prolyl cis-trans isomerase [Rhodohalobacter sp. 614A]